ncbi:hypothetical protein BJX65DRAFT_253626 [Aspergillus insuetus]
MSTLSLQVHPPCTIANSDMGLSISRQAGEPTPRVVIQQLSPLLQLPTELIQYIAYLLPTDLDRAHLASCSFHLASKILPAESHIWRWLFRDFYDDKLVRTEVDYKTDYQVRELVVTQGTHFRYGQGREQTFWLNLINRLIVEATVSLGFDFHTAEATETDETVDSIDLRSSKNLARIRAAIVGSEFLKKPVSGYMSRDPNPPSDLFCAIQLHLTYIALDPSMSVRCLRTDYDMRQVYPFFAEENTLFSRCTS